MSMEYYINVEGRVSTHTFKVADTTPEHAFNLNLGLS